MFHQWKNCPEYEVSILLDLFSVLGVRLLKFTFSLAEVLNSKITQLVIC